MFVSTNVPNTSQGSAEHS